MVERRIVLGAVVGKIGVPGGPVEVELALGFAAVDPPELHVHGLDVLGNDGVIDDSDGSGVIGLDWRLGLWPTHLDE